MEIKLKVSIGATLQVKNARGEWDWIKPEVGAEISIPDPTQDTDLQQVFADLWDNVVGPQFGSVVSELINDQVAPAKEVAETSNNTAVDATETVVTDDDEYY